MRLRSRASLRNVEAHVWKDVDERGGVIRLAPEPSKELAETVARHILLSLGHDPSRYGTFPRLLKAAVAALDLGSEPTTDASKASPALAMVTGGLGQVAEGVAALRNLYGTGHGRIHPSGADKRHARLVVGACATVANFLIETLEGRS